MQSGPRPPPGFQGIPPGSMMHQPGGPQVPNYQQTGHQTPTSMPRQHVPQMMMQGQAGGMSGQPGGVPGQPGQQGPPQHPQQQQHPPSASMLSKFGADMVQEVVSRTLDMFQLLRVMNTNNPVIQEEKKTKVQEMSKNIETYFQRIRIIYSKCDNLFGYIDEHINTSQVLESLIPFGDDDSEEENDDKDQELCDLVNQSYSKDNSFEDKDDKSALAEPGTSLMGNNNNKRQKKNLATSILSQIDDERRRNNPKLQALEQEYQNLLELDQLKSRQLKDIIDRLRQLVWDINTMLATRKP